MLHWKFKTTVLLQKSATDFALRPHQNPQTPHLQFCAHDFQKVLLSHTPSFIKASYCSCTMHPYNIVKLHNVQTINICGAVMKFTFTNVTILNTVTQKVYSSKHIISHLVIMYFKLISFTSKFQFCYFYFTSLSTRCHSL